MSIQHKYTYEGTLADAFEINWRVEDLIGGDKRLDFSKPFLPDTLARTAGLEGLKPAERLVLNQILGATYLHLFGLVEEFILPFALDRARDGAFGDKQRVRALVTFAEEEAKHQLLFSRFADEFERGFPVKLEVIRPPKAIADAVLGHSTLGVAILILHLEWLTQRHYSESVKSDTAIDPRFASLLKHHWQEEAQHTKVDTLIAAELAAAATPEAIERAIDDFIAIGGILDGGLQQQVKFDVAALERVIGRTLTTAQREEIERVQLASYRWTFLVSGLEQPNFVKAVAELSEAGLGRVRGRCSRARLIRNPGRGTRGGGRPDPVSVRRLRSVPRLQTLLVPREARRPELLFACPHRSIVGSNERRRVTRARQRRRGLVRCPFMARLVHVDASLLGAERGFMRPPLSGDAAWKPARPHEATAVEPWFELSPRGLSIDTRVSSAGPGVAASLEVFGIVASPTLASFGQPGVGVEELVLGGNAVPIGTPAPEFLDMFDRQCTARIAVATESVARGRQCLLLVSVTGRGRDEQAGVQIFVGRVLVSEALVRGPDRLAILVEVPGNDELAFDLRLRLSGAEPHVRLGLRGVQAFLL